MPKVKPDRSEVTKFDKDNLKHVSTTEKGVLPDQKGTVLLCLSLFDDPKHFSHSGWFYLSLLAIQDERVDSRAEVKSFDKSNLKHVDTVEKNPLPDAGSM